MDKSIRSFRDLIVWRKAMDLAVAVYRITRTFPKEEMFVLTAQIRRAAISIPSNIAEGHARQGREYCHYLSIARGSAADLDTQLLLAVELGYTTAPALEPLSALLAEIRRKCVAIAGKLAPNP